MSRVHNAISTLGTRDLLHDESRAVALDLLSGSVATEDTVQLLTLLSNKGETCDEILGFIHAMREHMVPVALTQRPLLDICGTGGSLPNRFNVSTCAALLLGGMGVCVAKHGNRGSKAPNGSFDFLDAMGIPYDFTPEEHQAHMDQYGCTFLFARTHHPAVRHVAEARKQLSGRSIFNLIGPFCNPASPTHQMIGTPSAAIATRLTEVAAKLDYTAIGIITSDIGLDECSTVGKSTITMRTGNDTRTVTIDPTQHGIHHTLDDIKGGSAIENAALFKQLVQNKAIDHPIMQLIVFNVAVMRHLLTPDTSIDDYMVACNTHITSGVFASSLLF
jgi:anthranilate phosphoribosyltransferase